MNPYGSYGGFNSAGYNSLINPMQPQIERLNQMQQMQQMNQQPQYQQPNQQQIQQPQGQSIIPVASIEEVKGHPVDWSGNPNYFADNVNKKIYIKQLGINGAPSISVYTLDTEPTETKEGYCTKEEFNALKGELENYKGVLDNLLNQLGGKGNE